MIGISWIFLSGILLAAELENKHRTAEVALVSVLGLNNTDNVDNINFLDKVEKVIGNIKSVFESKTSIRPSDDDVKLEKFIDFIQNLIKRLKKYDDTDLKHFFTIFNDEIRKYHYRGCKFHELLENYSLRTYLSNLFNNLRTQPGVTIKNNLETIANKIADEKFNRNEKNLVDVINSMYRQDSVEKFQNFLVKIDTYRSSTEKMNLDLVKIIKEGLRSIIFDYYSQLNNNARSALKYQVNDFWIKFSQNKPFALVDSFKSFRAQKDENLVRTKNKLTTKQFYNNSNEDLKHDEHGNMNSQVKEQSIYLSNSIKTSKCDKNIFKRFRNDGYIKIDQTMLPDDRFIYIKNQKLDDNSGLQSRSTIIYTTRYLETRKKKLTFKTLYPDLVPEWTSVIPVPSRRYMSFRSPMHHHSAKRRKLIRKYGRVKGRRLVKESGVSTKVGVVSSNVPRIKTDSLRHKVAVNKFGLPSRKTVREITTYKTKQQKRMHPFRIYKNITTFKRTRLGIRHQNLLFTQRVNNYRRSYKKDSIISEEGLSIDLPEVHHNKFRRSDTNFTPSDPGSRKAQIIQSTSVAVNNETHNTTIIIGEVNNELLNDEDKFIRSQEKQKYDTDSDSLKKSEKRYQIKTRVDDKELTDVKENNKTFEVTTQLNYNWDSDKKLEAEKNKVTTYTRQNKQDESPIFNYRATHSSNETEIKSKKDEVNRVTQSKITLIMNDSKGIELENNNDIRKSEKEEKPAIYEENQPNEDADVKNIKTDNDFKTFIEDYDNDLDEYKRNKEKIGIDKVTVSSESVNNIEKDIDTSNIITTKTTLSSTTATSVTKKSTTSQPTVVATKPPPIVASIIRSLNEKQDLSHHDTTIKSFFDANLLKHLMKTTTIRTTTQQSVVLGRYVHHDGVLVDSMEELKEEVAEATNLNYGGEQ